MRKFTFLVLGLLTSGLCLATPGVDAAPGDPVVNGKVYIDDDLDGVFNGAFDSPLAGVTLEIGLDGGPVLLTTVSDAAGDYSFPDLPTGTLFVRIAASPGNDAVLSGLTIVSPTPLIVVVATNDVLVGQDFRFGESRISGRAYVDDDLDGLWDPLTEAPIQGLTLNLWLGTPAGFVVIDQGVTIADGTYTFVGLSPGDFALTIADGNEALLAGLEDVTRTQYFTLLAGERVTGADIRFHNGPTICGRVFCDGATDANFDPNSDRPLRRITMLLVDSLGVVVNAVATDFGGRYCFLIAAPGTYTVQVGSGQPSLSGLTPLVDNQVVLVGPTDIVNDVDMLYVGRESIFGDVFIDADDNGSFGGGG